MAKLRLSYSQADTFLNCRKMWWWQYEECLFVKEKARPLALGDLVHTLFHIYHTGKLTTKYIERFDKLALKKYPDFGQQALDLAIEAVRLFNAYIQKYGSEKITLVSSELPLEYEFDHFILYGKIDGLARPEGDKRLFRMEHKTTAATDSAYLNGLKGGLQNGLYDKLCQVCLPEPTSGTIFNLLIKTKEPKAERNQVMLSHARMDIAMATMEGVARDILNHDIYPSSKCFFYNRECDYLKLCLHDSPRTREAFYVHQPRVLPGQDSKKKGGDSK